MLDVSTALGGVHTAPLAFVIVHCLSFHLMHSQHEMQEANEWMTLWLCQPSHAPAPSAQTVFLDNGAYTDRDSNARLPTRSLKDSHYTVALCTVQCPYCLLFPSGELWSGVRVMRTVTHCLPVTLLTSKVLTVNLPTMPTVAIVTTINSNNNNNNNSMGVQ